MFFADCPPEFQAAVPSLSMRPGHSHSVGFCFPMCKGGKAWYEQEKGGEDMKVFGLFDMLSKWDIRSQTFWTLNSWLRKSSNERADKSFVQSLVLSTPFPCRWINGFTHTYATSEGVIITLCCWICGSGCNIHLCFCFLVLRAMVYTFSLKQDYNWWLRCLGHRLMLIFPSPQFEKT